MPTTETLVEEATAASYRLEDLDVKEVSVVDRGANMRKLLIVKNAEVPMPTNAQPAATPEAKSGDPVVDAQASKAEATTDLIVALPVELRDELGKMLDGIAVRVGALSEAVKATEPGEGGLSDKFKSEIVGLGSVMKRLGGVEKSKAINALDKAALASGDPIDHLGIPRVSKDASVEYVMTAEGPLMKMPPGEMMKVAMRYAIDEMYKAEDCLYYDEDMGGACAYLFSAMKALGPFIADSPATLAMAEAVLGKQYAFNQPQPSIAAGVPSSHKGANEPPEGMGKGNAGDLTKGRPQFSDDRLSKLEGMFAVLQQVLTDVRPAPAPAVTDVEDEIKKDEGEPVSPDVQLALTKMAGLIKSLEAENKTLKSSRPLGNAAVGGTPPSQPKSAKVHWPDDLNDLAPDLDS